MASIVGVHLGSLPAKITPGTGRLGELSSATEYYSAICRSYLATSVIPMVYGLEDMAGFHLD